METEEKKQADSPVEETQQEEQQAEVTEEQQQEQVKALLSETQEPAEAEPQAEAETETEVEEKVPEVVFTDEIIDKYPSLKMFRGKTITEIAPAYQKIVSKYQDQIRENKELKGKLEQTSLKELGEPPDPIDNPKEFREWQDRRDALIRADERSKISQPEPEVNYMAEIQKRLPDVDVNKLAKEWSNYNARWLFDEQGILRQEIKKLYQDDPELLVDGMVSFYNLTSKANQNELTIEKKAKQEAFTKTKEAFKQARKTQKESSQVNVVSRTNELTPEDEILQKIYQSVQ